MRRTVALVVFACMSSGGSHAQAVQCWLPPVSAPVVDQFREPACRWCPGSRGIEYGTSAGDPVRAVAAGTVTFSGTVAGQDFVVVRHADGKRVTYGNLADRRFADGDVIAAGVIVGHATGHLHFGLRDDDRYVDPAPYIGRLAGAPRLIPADGSPAAPAGPPRLVCAAS